MIGNITSVVRTTSFQTRLYTDTRRFSRKICKQIQIVTVPILRREAITFTNWFCLWYFYFDILVYLCVSARFGLHLYVSMGSGSGGASLYIYLYLYSCLYLYLYLYLYLTFWSERWSAFLARVLSERRCQPSFLGIAIICLHRWSAFHQCVCRRKWSQSFHCTWCFRSLIPFFFFVHGQHLNVLFQSFVDAIVFL